MGKECGEKKEKHRLSKPVVKDSRLILFKHYSTKVVFGVTFTMENLTVNKCIECFHKFLKNRTSLVILIMDGHLAHKSKG